MSGAAGLAGWRGRLRALAAMLAGWLVVAGLGAAADMLWGPGLIAGLQRGADAAIAAAGAGPGITARFVDSHGWQTRHPQLQGVERIDEQRRLLLAQAVAAVPGMGGVRWAAVPAADAGPDAAPPAVADCQSHVQAILATRTIRFAEGRATIDPASRELLDEVAAALRPCAGGVIAITGHTNASGDAETNLALSRERALAVRNALALRGIDLAGLRARGVGSAQPLPGLTADDPANRRIEFSVIAPVSLEPTVVDTPGPY
ncbi:MAG TPA: OmpA family protein [Novosphingobium sp.]|nr:OmpA family protein [Novosphingobium sp.]